MRNLLEVKEFDKISCNENYKKEYAYLEETVFNTLEEFLCDFSGRNEYADALEFMNIKYQKGVGKTISVSNYVGVIQLGNGFQIQVLPKIDFVNDPEEGANTQTKRLFLKMLHSMIDFPSKVFNDANLNLDQMPLYEIFINMYLQETRKLVKHGLKSAYIGQEENQVFYKGKLLISEQINRNAAHRERFYVHYDEYLADRAENRLVKSTLQKLQSVSSSSQNQKEIRQLLGSFEMVSPSDNYHRDFNRVVIDRNTRDYDLLIEWAKVFLLNKSFSTFSGDNRARALLFPMEKVFESYVAQKLKAALRDQNWRITTQDKGYYLFDEPKKFSLRPDIVITKDDGCSKIILDTKWKRLTDKRANYGISQADMYQVYAYAKKYETGDVWLLYPATEEMRGHEDIVFKSDDNVQVRVFFVDVAKIEESLDELRGRLGVEF